MGRPRKAKIMLNDIDSLTHLMQETYNDASNQQLDAQRAINELTKSAQPIDVEDYTKIARERANFLKVKDSATRIKLELSKIQYDIMKQFGNTPNTESEGAITKTIDRSDFSKVRELLKKSKENKISSDDYDLD